MRLQRKLIAQVFLNVVFSSRASRQREENVVKESVAAAMELRRYLMEIPKSQPHHVCITGNHAHRIAETFFLEEGQEFMDFKMESELAPANQCIAQDLTIGNTLFLIAREIQDRCAARWKAHSSSCDVLIHAHSGTDCDQLWKFRMISDQCNAPLLIVSSNEQLLECYKARVVEARSKFLMPADEGCMGLQNAEIVHDKDKINSFPAAFVSALQQSDKKMTAREVRNRQSSSFVCEECSVVQKKDELRQILYRGQQTSMIQDAMLELMRKAQNLPHDKGTVDFVRKFVGSDGDIGRPIAAKRGEQESEDTNEEGQQGKRWRKGSKKQELQAQSSFSSFVQLEEEFPEPDIIISSSFSQAESVSTNPKPIDTVTVVASEGEGTTRSAGLSKTVDHTTVTAAYKKEDPRKTSSEKGHADNDVINQVDTDMYSEGNHKVDEILVGESPDVATQFTDDTSSYAVDESVTHKNLRKTSSEKGHAGNDSPQEGDTSGDNFGAPDSEETNAVDQIIIKADSPHLCTDDRCAIIIDNGSGLMKAGFGDEDSPRVIFQSMVGIPKYQAVLVGRDHQEMVIADDERNLRGVTEIQYPIEHGIIRNWNQMSKIWEHTFQNELGVEDLTAYSVLLSEPPLNPKQNRREMAKIMFEQFNVKEVYIGMQAILALYGSGRDTGVIVEIGDGVTHVVPVFEGYALPHAIRRLDLAGRDLTLFMARLLTELDMNSGVTFVSTAELEIARDIKEQLGFVSLNYDLDMQETESSWEAKNRSRTFEMPDGQIIKVGTGRFRVAEPLFRPRLLGVEHGGIHKMVVDSVSLCDVDLRRRLYQNIILSGGSTMFPGLEQRLTKEIQALVPEGVEVQVLADGNRVHGVWTGSRILSNLGQMDNMWFTQADYEDADEDGIFDKADLNLNM